MLGQTTFVDGKAKDCQSEKVNMKLSGRVLSRSAS